MAQQLSTILPVPERDKFRHTTPVFIEALLAENLEADRRFNSNIKKELIHFLRFSSTMIWAFPTARFMRWRIRKNKQLKYILQFKELLPVRNNIEKGSFAYDSLLFNTSPVSLLKNKSHLANLVCLAILFGDEFIDGIAEEHGKKNIQQVFADEKFNYYLQYKMQNDACELYYEFDICEVLPPHVLAAANKKYEITYRVFYSHLLFLLDEMNRHLSGLDMAIREEAAQLICRACNKCFDTYKEDITSFNPDYTFAELQQYQKTKDDDIIQVLLTLRAVLLEKKQLQYQAQFASWSSMVRSMQLYDDMQDIAHDCNYQMNTLAWFAKNYFISEWHWLLEHTEKIKALKGMELHGTVSLFMPASVMLTMQYARNIAHTKLNWVQRKIQNYLWRKNWLGFNNPLLNENKCCLSGIMQKQDTSIPLKLHYIQQHIMGIQHKLVTEEMKWAHLADIMLMDDELKKHLEKKLSKKDVYFLKSCFIEFPLQKKAGLIKKLF